MTLTPLDERREPRDPRRRRLLQALSAALGGAAAARLAGPALLTSALAWADGGTAPTCLDDGELTCLQRLCDHVIPATDTPGAVELGVHRCVDHLLAVGVDEAQRDAARFALSVIDGHARARHGVTFAATPTPAQRRLLEDLEAQRDGFGPDERGPFRGLKALIVFAYCTTEAGATRLLAWDPVPGGYTGSVPYDDIGKAWFS